MIIERNVKRTASHLSLFYAEVEWKGLIEKVLYPILASYNGCEGFGYIVHFSTDRGDGIHLTIFTNERKQARQILSNIRINAQIFFSATPSKIIRQSRFLPMFANFDNNSIHFGIHLFLPRLSNSSTIAYSILWENVSRMLFRQLVKLDFSLENLFWLSIQIFLLLSLKDNEFRNGIVCNIEKRIGAGEIPDVFVERLQESQFLLSDIMSDAIAMKEGKFDDENAFIGEICSEIEVFVIKAVSNFHDPGAGGRYLDVVPYVVIDLRTILGYSVSSSLLADFFLYNLLQRQEINGQVINLKSLD